MSQIIDLTIKIKGMTVRGMARKNVISFPVSPCTFFMSVKISVKDQDPRSTNSSVAASVALFYSPQVKGKKNVRGHAGYKYLIQ